jgi:hypothetical protein
MKTIVLVMLALAFAALILAFSTAEAATVRRVPDVTAIASAPAVTIATERTFKTRAALKGDTDTAD